MGPELGEKEKRRWLEWGWVGERERGRQTEQIHRSAEASRLEKHLGGLLWGLPISLSQFLQLP